MSEKREATLARHIMELGEERTRVVLERDLEGRASEKEIEAARADYHTDDINIDDDALVSRADNGYWVGAWVWVYYPDCDKCGDQHDPAVICETAEAA